MSLDWQLHVYGKANADLRGLATSVGIPVHEWPWTEVARQAGLLKDALCVVRPDGHIGFARPTQDVAELRAYLLQHVEDSLQVGHGPP
jgi:hypothetical protein